MSNPIPKFQVGDVVSEANAFGMAKDSFDRRTGVSKSCKRIKNKAGHAHFHYEVLWNGYTSTTLRVQHRLKAKTAIHGEVAA